MSNWPFVKLQRISLHNHPALGGSWIHDRIAEDPSILGLGALSLNQREACGNGLERLTVTRPGEAAEISLLIRTGATDEAQFVRTLECSAASTGTIPAVLVSEDVSERYLNLISRIRQVAPIAAVQMEALQIGEQGTVNFTTVAGELAATTVQAAASVSDATATEAGAETCTINECESEAVVATPAEAAAEQCTQVEAAAEEQTTEVAATTTETSESTIEPAVAAEQHADPESILGAIEDPYNRSYWEHFAPSSVSMADRLLAVAKALDPAIELDYRPDYIGLSRNGQPVDFARFTPEPSGLVLGLNMEQNSLIELSIAQSGLERVSNEDTRGYQVRLGAENLDAQQAPVARLMQLAFEESRS